MLRNSRVIRLALGALLLSVPCFAQDIPLDQALRQLQSYRFGQNDKLLNALREYTIRSQGNPSVRGALQEGLADLLDSQAAYGAKQFACRQLVLIATEKQVPALARHLSDPALSHIVLYVLSHIPGTAVDRALTGALGKAAAREKIGILNTLGNRRSAAAAAAVAAQLGDSDGDVAEEAALALGRIGTTEAAGILRTAFGDKGHPAHDVLPEACLACSDALLRNGQGAKAATLYETVFKADIPPFVRAAALKGLVEARGSQAREYIKAALESDNKHLYRMACQIIRTIGDKRSAEAFASEFFGFKPEVQSLIINALASRSDGAGVATIKKACQSKNQEVRIAALGALGRLGDGSCVSLLAGRAATGSADEQAVALASLVTLRGGDVNTALIAPLARADGSVQRVLITALHRRNAQEAAAVLIKTAQSPDRAVSSEALKALRDLAGPQDMGALIELLFRKDMAQAELLSKAIASAAHRHDQEAECVRRILAGQRGFNSVQQRVVILSTLGELGGGSALAALRKGLTDKNDAIRYMAIKALAGWSSVEPAADLLRVARTSKNQTHRILALRGFIDLVDKADLPAERKLAHYREAMQWASEATEKKKVLSVVGHLVTPEALGMAVSYLEDVQLRDEAAQTGCVIAEKLYAKNGRDIKPLVERIVNSRANAQYKERAGQIREKIEQIKDYITNWEVSGPYVQKGKNYSALHDIAFAPEIDGGKGARWRPMPAGTAPKMPWYLDLLKALEGGEQRVAYLRARIDTDRAGAVVLYIGSDDGNKVWLNGKPVHSNNVARPFTVDQDKVSVTLQKGENTIMMKITQNNQPWGASLRVAGAGAPKRGKDFRIHTINADSRFEAAGIADMNRDGKLDIFCGGFWYEGPDWKKHFVREVREEGEYHYDFANLPMDVDGDGWTDIVNATWHDKKVFWIRNPGAGGGKFEEIVVDTPGNMETALAVDINGDGQTDVLPNIMQKAAWYEFRREASAPHGVKWITHALPQTAAGHGIGAGDVNRDGRCDIVAVKGWLEQTADSAQPWKWHAEFDLGNCSIPALVHDVEGDGDSDIIWGWGHHYGLFWLEQGRDEKGGRTWKTHEIDKSWSQPHFLLLADLNNDGEKELMTGKRYRAHNGHDPGGNDPVCVYYYRFNKAGKKWVRHLISEGGRVGFGINTMAADMDGDGDIDVVAPGKSGLYLLENLFK